MRRTGRDNSRVKKKKKEGGEGEDGEEGNRVKINKCKRTRAADNGAGLKQ